ncbi:MAG TPA: hypothetical protein DF409_00925 [Bacteroidales bacterium]|nr:hypothetical protein [Bacteroidales bacterium]
MPGNPSVFTITRTTQCGWFFYFPEQPLQAEPAKPARHHEAVFHRKNTECNETRKITNLALITSTQS